MVFLPVTNELHLVVGFGFILLIKVGGVLWVETVNLLWLWTQMRFIYLSP